MDLVPQAVDDTERLSSLAAFDVSSVFFCNCSDCNSCSTPVGQAHSVIGRLIAATTLTV